MKAAVFHGAQDIRVENVTDPAGPGAHEVLLRPLWCGICGTDLHEFAMGPIVIPVQPHALNGSQLPQILGHEFSGEVLEVGSEVRHVRAGQRVSVMPLLYCGECYYCRRGLNHLCQSMACVGLSDAWGGIAERAIVPARNVSVLPDEVSDLQGALVEPGAVAAYGVDVAQVRPGDTVLVTGAGPIGALAALYSAANGARVIISEPNPTRAALALSLDVGEVVDPSQVDVVAWVKEQTDGIGVDAAIECSGNERALQAALGAVRSAGRISQTGLHTRPASIEPMGLSEHDVTLAGTWCYPVSDWPRIIGLISSGRYPVEKVVSAQIGMDDVVHAGFETLLAPSGDQVKVLVQAR
jgi:(R,R)-butanediol dehydrogenase / meso-butanediol dehydrogenase / diacetyl reductase